MKCSESRQESAAAQRILQMAVSQGDVQEVRSLLAKGVDPNTPALAAMPAIHTAAFYGHHEVLRILLDAGANLRLKGPKGFCALRYAVMARDDVAATILIERGSDVASLSNDSTSPLHTAVNNDDPVCARLLLDHGLSAFASVTAPPAGYLTPFQLAVHRGRIGLIELFARGNEVDFDQTSHSGKTLEELAVGKLKVVTFLRSMAAQQAIRSGMELGPDGEERAASTDRARMRSPGIL
jgi:ankyrin repeat protein